MCTLYNHAYTYIQRERENLSLTSARVLTDVMWGELSSSDLEVSCLRHIDLKCESRADPGWEWWSAKGWGWDKGVKMGVGQDGGMGQEVGVGQEVEVYQRGGDEGGQEVGLGHGVGMRVGQRGEDTGGPNGWGCRWAQKVVGMRVRQEVGVGQRGEYEGGLTCGDECGPKRCGYGWAKG